MKSEDQLVTEIGLLRTGWMKEGEATASIRGLRKKSREALEKILDETREDYDEFLKVKDAEAEKICEKRRREFEAQPPEIRHGALLVFKKDTKLEAIKEALKKLLPLVDENYRYPQPSADTPEDEYVEALIEEYDAKYGGPVWYIP